MKKKIKKIIYSNMFLCKIYAQLKYFVNKNENQKIVQIMSQFLDKKIMEDKKIVRKTIKDVLFSKMYYTIDYKEYFQYEFIDASHDKRKGFISNIERLEDELYNCEEYKELLNDKYKSYLKFKDWYKRDIIKISGEDDKSLFEDFCKKHSSFMVKPIASNQGKGIYIIDQKDYKSINDIWDKIKQDKEIIIEELIVQDRELGKLHDKSVNTVRISTYIKDDNVTILFAFLRMGQGDAIVDNAHAGGIIANIDLETGIVDALGKDFNGKKYLKHPNSGICIVGYQIPKWEELCNMAEEVAKVLSEYKYVAWDFALTEKGWVIVETNSNGSYRGYQLFGNGIRERYEKASK